MMQKNIAYRKSRGLTLMELMIAMAIGLMLLGGALTMFINNKRIYKTVNEVGRMQENARFAMEMLTRDIRMAGFYGCHHDITQVNNYIVGSATAGSLFDASFGIEGIEGNATAWSPSGNTDAGAFGAGIGQRFTDTTVPDAVTVRYLSGEFWDVVDDNDPGPDNWEAGGNIKDAQYMQSVSDWAIVSTVDDHPNAGDRANDFAPGELLSVTDCASSDIFQLTTQCASSNTTFACGNAPNGRIRHQNGGGAASVLPGNTGANFTRVYQQGTKVRRYVAVRYFIGNGQYGGPSLFRQYPVLDANNTTTNDDNWITVTTQELLEGVENMQIMYGVDTDLNGVPENYYVAGSGNLDDATEWSNVTSVKIALLLRTVDQDFASGIDTKNDYKMLGQNVNPADLAVRRRVFTTTIQLRNRVSR